MQKFKITQEGLMEIRKKSLIRSIPMLVIAITIGVAISTMNSAQNEVDLNVLIFVVPIVAFALGFAIYRGINRQKALLSSYTVTITNNLITKEQLNTRTISIYFNDIKRIERSKNGGFIIKGKDRSDLIIIPRQIENYAELEIALQKIQSVVEETGTSFLKRYRTLSGLIALALMLCTFTVKNKVLLSLSGWVWRH